MYVSDEKNPFLEYAQSQSPICLMSLALASVCAQCDMFELSALVPLRRTTLSSVPDSHFHVRCDFDTGRYTCSAVLSGFHQHQRSYPLDWAAVFGLWMR